MSATRERHPREPAFDGRRAATYIPRCVKPSVRALSPLVLVSWLWLTAAGCASGAANAAVEAPHAQAAGMQEGGVPHPPPPRPNPAESTRFEPIPLSGFSDATKHYQASHDSRDYARYAPDQVVEIATNILLYQRLNGGWPANFDPTRILTDAEARKIWKKRNAKDTTLDNRTTYTHTEYLAAAHGRTGELRFRDGAYRGLDYLLRAQTPSGGWPHSFPSTSGYHPHITFLDDVMVGVLRTLRNAATGATPFSFLDDRWKNRCALAHKFGEETLLRLQVRQGRALTVWAGQYDRDTLRPARGRTFELPSLVSTESVEVVRYLMSIEEPSPQVRAAIHGAMAWFERSKIEGIRLEKVQVVAQRHAHHTSREDVVVVKDPAAPPLWTRFYDLEDNRPFFSNRNGKKVYKLSKVSRERRTGYRWYDGTPARLLTKEYPKWLATWGETAADATRR